MKIFQYTYTEPELVEFANQVRRCVVRALQHEQALTAEQATNFNDTHIVVIAEPWRWFPWFKNRKKGVRMTVVKLLERINDEPYE